jgi:hypothetical protein
MQLREKRGCVPAHTWNIFSAELSAALPAYTDTNENGPAGMRRAVRN